MKEHDHDDIRDLDAGTDRRFFFGAAGTLGLLAYLGSAAKGQGACDGNADVVDVHDLTELDAAIRGAARFIVLKDIIRLRLGFAVRAIPSTKVLVVPHGAGIELPAHYRHSVKIEAAVDAGPYQIFYGPEEGCQTTPGFAAAAGNSPVIGLRQRALAEWFGAARDGLQNDWHAIQSALEAAGFCQLLRGVYLIDRPIYLGQRALHGHLSSNSTLICSDTNGGFSNDKFVINVPANPNDPDGPLVPLAELDYPTGTSAAIYIGNNTSGFDSSFLTSIENLRIECNGISSLSGIVSKGTVGEQTTIRRVMITGYNGYGIGIPVGFTQNVDIDNVWILNPNPPGAGGGGPLETIGIKTARRGRTINIRNCSIAAQTCIFAAGDNVAIEGANHLEGVGTDAVGVLIRNTVTTNNSFMAVSVRGINYRGRGQVVVIDGSKDTTHAARVTCESIFAVLTPSRMLPDILINDIPRDRKVAGTVRSVALYSRKDNTGDPGTVITNEPELM